jgi:hypothetical protein
MVNCQEGYVKVTYEFGSRASRGKAWIPAFAGMTDCFWDALRGKAWIPAFAGMTDCFWDALRGKAWIPAFAGMTDSFRGASREGLDTGLRRYDGLFSKRFAQEGLDIGFAGMTVFFGTLRAGRPGYRPSRYDGLFRSASRRRARISASPVCLGGFVRLRLVAALADGQLPAAMCERHAGRTLVIPAKAGIQTPLREAPDPIP